MIYLEMTVRLRLAPNGERKELSPDDLIEYHDDIKIGIHRVYDEVGFTSDDFSVEGFTVSAPVRVHPDEGQVVPK